MVGAGVVGHFRTGTRDLLVRLESPKIGEIAACEDKCVEVMTCPETCLCVKNRMLSFCSFAPADDV